jgi:hypothetical protein
MKFVFYAKRIEEMNTPGWIKVIFSAIVSGIVTLCMIGIEALRYPADAFLRNNWVIVWIICYALLLSLENIMIPEN